MTPRDHAVLGAIGAAALYPTLGFNSALFWLGSVFIDIDHYADFVCRNRFTDFSFTNMVRYCKVLDGYWRYPEFLALSALHTVEFLIPFGLIALFTGSAPMEALLWGFVFHVVLDAAYLGRQGAMFIRVFSVTEYVLRIKKLKAQGYRPGAIYDKAIDIIHGKEDRNVLY